MDPINPTLTLTEAATRAWDAIVLGAGVAGCVAAHQLATAGASVLLIDKQRFPRDKVCGGCLSARAISILQSINLAHTLDELASPSLNSFEVYPAPRNADPSSSFIVPSSSFPTGRIIIRRTFDAALAQAAITAGAHFLPETTATVTSPDAIHLQQRNQHITLGAKVILAATGLASSSATTSHITPNSKIGACAIIPSSPEWSTLPPNTTQMFCAPHGYLGAVRAADNQIILAAALDPKAIKRETLLPIVASILEAHHHPAAEQLRHLTWRTTPALTRRGTLTAPRTFFLGDAAGYIEPFTGEGMTWAFTSALIAAPIALDAINHGWSPKHAQAYTRAWQREIAPRQRICRAIATTLDRPRLLRLALMLFNTFPKSINPLLTHLNRAWTPPRTVP